jgi:hypothetical protein
MFGRRAKEQPDHERPVEVDVDHTLEQDVSGVEQAVDAYLQNPNESLRKDLLTELEKLDNQCALGDDYHARVRIGRVGSSVVGATTTNSMGEEVPATELQAQVALVKAAKRTVTRLTPDTLADLRAANEALAKRRPKGQ